jgi:hypothetical protein
VASWIEKLQLPLKVKRGKLGSSTIVAIAKLLLRRYFVVEHDVDTETFCGHGVKHVREESPEYELALTTT